MSRYCDQCGYLQRPYYEENYYECYIFGAEPPEDAETEDGCNCTDEELERLAREKEGALIDQWGGFADWLEEQEKKERTKL